MAGHVHQIACFPAVIFQIRGIHQDNAAAMKYAAIAVVESINGSVVLVVTAEGREKKLPRSEKNRLDCGNGEVGLSGPCLELIDAGRIWQAEATFLPPMAIPIFPSRDQP